MAGLSLAAHPNHHDLLHRDRERRLADGTGSYVEAQTIEVFLRR